MILGSLFQPRGAYPLWRREHYGGRKLKLAISDTAVQRIAFMGPGGKIGMAHYFGLNCTFTVGLNQLF